MNHSIYRISLDIHEMSSQVSISVKRGDTCRRIVAVLTENGKPYAISGCEAKFRMKKPAKADGDRDEVFDEECTIANNAICYTLKSGCTDIAGVADCEFNLYGKNNELLTSPHFTVVIDDTVVSDEAIEATEAFSNLTKSLNEVNTLREGFESVRSNVANAITATKRGSFVSVDDVSSIEHPVRVKLASGSVDDFSAATLYSCGKNLVNVPAMVNAQLVDNGDSTFTLTKNYAESRRGLPLDVFIPAGSVVTLSTKVLTKTANTNLYLVFESADKATEEIFITETSSKNRVLVNDCVKIYISIAYSAENGSSVTFSDFQLEYGDAATTYEPFKGKTYTPNADGTVNVVSVYPTMTLFTDTEDATIECEYNVDTKKYIDRNSGTPGGGGVSSAAYISSVTMLSANWKAEPGFDNLYSQVVTINGVTENSKVDLNPSVQDLATFHKKDIAFVTENEDGNVTVYCVGQKPANDYTMQVTITEVIV